jgi:hypothetical protein
MHTNFCLDRKLSAVTYDFNGGRLGDNFASFARAKWISYKCDIPLLYKPFPFSDQLVLHETEKLFDDTDLHNFKATITLKKFSYNQIQKNAENLYITKYQLKMPENIFADQIFMAKLKKLLTPIFLKEKVPMHKKRANVAIHVRTGGSFLPDANRVNRQPLRFPPHLFYIDSIRSLYQIIKQPLYVYIFTDDVNPAKLALEFLKELNDIDIEFGYRKDANDHDINVIEDFCAMTKFDYLIRPKSHFSIWAQRLGNPKIVIYPRKAVLLSDGWFISKISITKLVKRD